MITASLIKHVRTVVLAALALLVWSLLVMVYADRFVPPFDRISPFLLPWKELNRIPVDAGLGERLGIMQDILDASRAVSGYAFSVMAVSLAGVVISLTIVYQQKQRRVRENDILVLKNREIARRNEFIRYISATIGHEFKNNLGRIKRRIDLLPELPAEARHRIDDNLRKLFADIEIFKRISDEREAGLREFTRVDLSRLLHEVAGHYNDLALFQFLENAPPGPIYASATLLTTVIENILDNAVKYRREDQRLAAVTIETSLDTDGSRPYVTVSIRDEGRGMDEQQADQCFYQGKGSGGGWGQGLYFAKYVVGLHAGKIRIGRDYTAPGRGAEVIIKLPFVEEALDV